MLNRLLPIALAWSCSLWVNAQVDPPIAPASEQSMDDVAVPAPGPDHDATEPYTVVDQMPQFPGGEGAMMKFLQRTISYPEAERDAGIEGKVFIRFVVDREGLVGAVTVLRGVPGGYGLDQEAVRVVKQMPKWIPGKQNGKNVAVQYTLPIVFKLTQQSAPVKGEE